MLLGVGDAALAPKVAQVVSRLGAGRVLVVHGEDGLDEVTLGGATNVYEVTGSNVKQWKITPEDAGLPRTPLEAVRTGTAAENAATIRELFAGAKGPHRDYVLINAGAALYAAGRAKDLRDGVSQAAEAIDSGAAGRTLLAYVTVSQSFAANG
jgi:anthranilate phosphoribosyltransferase